jgi:uncharacterized protein (TIGR00251 family)
MLDIREYKNGVVFPVKVQPRAKQSQVTGIQEGALKIKVLAPPVEGAANEALIKLLSRFLGVRRTSIEILKGKTTHRKLIHCRNLGPKELKHLIEHSDVPALKLIASSVGGEERPITTEADGCTSGG